MVLQSVMRQGDWARIKVSVFLMKTSRTSMVSNVIDFHSGTIFFSLTLDGSQIVLGHTLNGLVLSSIHKC